MAASVRIEDEAFADERYEDLAALAGLADADHARGKMAKLWRQCTLEQRHVLPAATVTRILGERGVEALVEARLGEVVDGGVRIKGTKGRIEWLKKLRDNGKFGKKGGRPRKNPQGLLEKPTRVSENAFPETPPAPAPAPALPDPEISHTHARAIPPAPKPPTPTPTQAPPLVRSSTWERHRGWWQAMLDAHDRLRRPTADRPAIKPGAPDLAKHPHEQQLHACERYLREAGYDDAGVDAKMRHVVLVYEAEAERLQHLDFFKPALIWDTTRADRFPRKVDTSLEEARRGPSRAPALRAEPAREMRVMRDDADRPPPLRFGVKP